MFISKLSLMSGALLVGLIGGMQAMDYSRVDQNITMLPQEVQNYVNNLPKIGAIQVEDPCLKTILFLLTMSSYQGQPWRN